MTDYRGVVLSKRSGVGTVLLAHSRVNCYDCQFMGQFNEVLEQVNADDEIRVVLLMSASPSCFCVGADVKKFLANDTATNQALVNLARQALAKIEASSKVYIAVIDGHVLGGGLEMVLACDLRFASRGDYQFGLPEVNLGLMTGNGGSVRLPRLVGSSRAMHLLVTGDSIFPDEAYRIGLVDQLIAADKLVEEAEAYAQTLAQGPPLAIASIKRSVIDGHSLPLSEALALEDSLVKKLYDTRDAEEGCLAYQEKRNPTFRGE